MRGSRTSSARLDELVTPVGSLERGFAGFQTDLAAINLRLDNLDRRVERIERRLDLVEPAA